MKIGLLFYTDTTSLQEGGDLRGRTIANHSLLKSLCHHQSEHEVCVFVSTAEEIMLVESLLGSPGTHVSIRPFTDLILKFPEPCVDVLHVFGPDLYRAFYLRGYFNRLIPVTGMTHSLGHSAFFDWMLLNLKTGPRSCDRLICTSRAAEEVAKKIQENESGASLQTWSIPLGFEPFPIPQGRRLLKQEIEIDPDAVVFLYFGRLSQYTKMDLIPLLVSFSQLKKKTKIPCSLIIAGGDGIERYATLLKQVIEEYTLKGAVSVIPNPDQKSKEALFSLADVFVSPCDNLQETFGISLLEAMHAGLPILASDWSGYRDLVQDGRNGFLIPTLCAWDTDILKRLGPVHGDGMRHLLFSQGVAVDLEILTSRMQLLLENEHLRKSFSEESKKLSFDYHWSKIVSRYFGLWTSLILDPAIEKEQGTVFFPAYEKIFAHYPTQHLSGENSCVRTDLGGEVLKGNWPVRIYTCLDEIISVPILAELLKTLDHEKTVNDLVQSVAELCSPGLARYHLVWLFKNGLVRSDTLQ